MLTDLFSNPIYILFTVGGIILFCIVLYLFLLLHNVEERVSNLEEDIENQQSPDMHHPEENG
jgi:hypothetical protein